MPIPSKYTSHVNKECPLPEYPRPQFVRDAYTSLNGPWQYKICKDSEDPGTEWKEILVPFPVGSLLSGVSDILQEDETFYYRKHFSYTPQKERTVLHFEAVDQTALVYLNGHCLGSHRGGYLPFSFEISGYLQEENELLLAVKDPSNHGDYAYGKQSLTPGGIFYTPIAGIWQPVWLEDLGKEAVEDIRYMIDYDHSRVSMDLCGAYQKVTVTVKEGERTVAQLITAEKHIDLQLTDVRPWTCEDPFLYTVELDTADDHVTSYFGMRCFTVEEHRGQKVFCLNHQPVFLSGLLDQGYISDGIYTFPCEEAMEEELKTLKASGFNMLRKHIKIENRRWYSLCDRLGILVFQDMPSGGSLANPLLVSVQGMAGLKRSDEDPASFGRKRKACQDAYYEEAEGMIEHLYNTVSLCAYVPFNEGWGQFKAKEADAFFRRKDPSRPVDHASGWFDQGCGDFASKHIYFRPYKLRPDKKGRAIFLSEFGGYAYVLKQHIDAKKAGGYKKFASAEELSKALQELYRRDIRDQIPKGLCACVYTQVSDVEEECNGLFTYDREVYKVPVETWKEINEELYGEFRKTYE
ncbi:MAG: glycoside hydrolase family 2 [Erysipelotrichaceae bacterium]|nr:glycoside hydrolase family 2 [Erysipelotrichaceae bacterium]